MKKENRFNGSDHLSPWEAGGFCSGMETVSPESNNIQLSRMISHGHLGGKQNERWQSFLLSRVYTSKEEGEVNLE